MRCKRSMFRLPPGRYRQLPFHEWDHGRQLTMSTCHVDKSEAGDGCWNRDVGSSVNFPDLATRFEVVRAGMAPAVHEDLCLIADLMNRGRAPCGHVLPGRSPQLTAILYIESCEE